MRNHFMIAVKRGSRIHVHILFFHWTQLRCTACHLPLLYGAGFGRDAGRTHSVVIALAARRGEAGSTLHGAREPG